MNHIIDIGGVMLGVTYRRDSTGMAIIANVQGLGGDYKPTGPNLAPMLHMLYSMTGPMVVTPALSTIAEDLPA